jgi:[acyl-carrier-protein] S-malonyltransferase
MAVDPYYVTQDNGAGAPLHFAVTYRQLDMVRRAAQLPSWLAVLSRLYSSYK